MNPVSRLLSDQSDPAARSGRPLTGSAARELSLPVSVWEIWRRRCPAETSFGVRGEQKTLTMIESGRMALAPAEDEWRSRPPVPANRSEQCKHQLE